MVLAVQDGESGVPRPLALVEPAACAGVRRLDGMERVTNPWESVYHQGRGSVWGLQAPSRGFGSRSNKVFIYLNIPTLSRGTVV